MPELFELPGYTITPWLFFDRAKGFFVGSGSLHIQVDLLRMQMPSRNNLIINEE